LYVSTIATDLSSGIPWTTPAFQDVEIGPAAQSPTNGLANTNAIVAQAGAGTSYAAGLCKEYNAGGFNDWYLPAAWELIQCYNAAMIVNEVLGNTNGFNFNPFNSSYYWSSTEDGNDLAWSQNFSYGNPGNYVKFNDGNAVRAVRRF
jgi:hypothetical protein